MKKTRLCIYSGHSEILGGDLKYLIDLLNYFNTEKFEISLYTDRHPNFLSWIQPWMKVNIKINYLSTFPVLFKKSPIERGLERVNNRKLSKILSYIYRFVTGYYIRVKIINFIIFFKLFKKKEFDAFWFNNGGYPGKEAGLIACILARCFGVSNIVMTVHNVPVKSVIYRPFDFIYDWLLSRSVSTVISASHEICEMLKSYRGFSPSKVTTIYCGLEDCAEISENEKNQIREKMHISTQTKILLLVGNYDEDRKGHAFLVETLALVNKKFQDFILLVVGTGAAERKNMLMQKANEAGISAKIIFLGKRDDIHALNSIADICLVPSVGGEAVPYTIKEASRAARPVITTDSGGCSEGVLPNQSGIIVKTGDLDHLKESILSLLQDDARRLSMGKCGRRFFLENFRIEDKVVQHQELLRRLDK